MIAYLETHVEQIIDPILARAGVRLFIKREDLNHPLVSGNKWWKLKYNFEKARNEGHGTILTLGGAYSNHIFATAAAAREAGMASIGIIRGEEARALNSMLLFAQEQGMKFHFITRELYRQKHDLTFIEQLKKAHGDFFLIPEGGSNAEAVQGCQELAWKVNDLDLDVLCVPVGTGGTLAGLVAGLNGRKKVIGFSVLKSGSFLREAVSGMVEEFSGMSYDNFEIETRYHFGGYAKTNVVLDNFIKEFENQHGIPLEHVYTGKMLFGLYDMVRQGFFKKDTTIVAIHTGGLQARSLVR